MTEAVEWLDTQIETAARAMIGQVGDDSACTVHKDGRVTGGLKYHEGRLNAFAELRRLAQDGRLDAATMAEVERRWSGELSRRSDEPSSPLWISYATGGVEAVEEARVALPSHLTH